MSYELSDADVCIILSPCGLERFDTMLEDLGPDAREEVFDILGSADIEEAEDRGGNVMWLLRGVSWDTVSDDGVRCIHDFLFDSDNREHLLYMATGAEETYGDNDIDVGSLVSNLDPTFIRRISVWEAGIVTPAEPAAKPKEPEKFAQVWWTLDDLLGEQWRHNFTGPYPGDENGARLVLEGHEERIREAMIAAGWDAINEILSELVSEV